MVRDPGGVGCVRLHLEELPVLPDGVISPPGLLETGSQPERDSGFAGPETAGLFELGDREFVVTFPLQGHCESVLDVVVSRREQQRFAELIDGAAPLAERTRKGSPGSRGTRAFETPARRRGRTASRPRRSPPFSRGRARAGSASPRRSADARPPQGIRRASWQGQDRQVYPGRGSPPLRPAAWVALRGPRLRPQSPPIGPACSARSRRRSPATPSSR